MNGGMMLIFFSILNMTRHQYCLEETLEKILCTSSFVIYLAPIQVVALPAGSFFSLSTNLLSPRSVLEYIPPSR